MDERGRMRGNFSCRFLMSLSTGEGVGNFRRENVGGNQFMDRVTEIVTQEAGLVG
jgi:hypothetical protein